MLCWLGWVVLGDCRRPCAQWLVDQCEEVGASEGDWENRRLARHVCGRACVGVCRTVLVRVKP